VQALLEPTGDSRFHFSVQFVVIRPTLAISCRPHLLNERALAMVMRAAGRQIAFDFSTPGSDVAATPATLLTAALPRPCSAFPIRRSTSSWSIVLRLLPDRRIRHARPRPGAAILGGRVLDLSRRRLPGASPQRTDLLGGFGLGHLLTSMSFTVCGMP
jgi:hypothetical protein